MLMLLSTAAFSYAYDLVIIILQQQWALEKIKQLNFFSILILVKLLKIRKLKRFNLNQFWYKLQGVSIQCGSYWDYCEARTQWHGVCSKTIRRSNSSYAQKLLCWMVDALTQQLMILWSGCKMDCENSNYDCEETQFRKQNNLISSPFYNPD